MNRVFLSACPASNHPPIQLFVLLLSLLESTCISCKSSILTILRMLFIVLSCLFRVSCYRCSFFFFSPYLLTYFYLSVVLFFSWFLLSFFVFRLLPIRLPRFQHVSFLRLLIINYHLAIHHPQKHSR